MRINRNLKILIGVVIIFLVGISIWQIKGQEEQTRKEVSIEGKAVLMIDDGTGSLQNSEILAGEKTTAFDLLKKGVEQFELELSYKDSEFGVFIEAIGDKMNGEDEKYWLYYVNGEMPPVAADKKEIKAGDKVEFKFEKSPF